MTRPEAGQQIPSKPVVTLVAQLVDPGTLEHPTLENDGLELITQAHRRLGPLLMSIPALDLAVEPYRVRLTVAQELAPAVATLAASAQRSVWASDERNVAGPRLAIGMAAGPAFKLVGADGAVHWAGDAVDRADLLATQAGAGAVIVDTKMHSLLEQPPGPHASEDDRPQFGSKLTIRDRGDAVGYQCFELLWGDTHGLRRQGKLRRRRGTLQRWDNDRHHGFVATDDGNFFYTDRRYLTGQSDPRTGQTVYFMPISPLQPGKNPVASALVGVGDRQSGEVISKERRFWIRVTDRVMNTQDLPRGDEDPEFVLEHGDSVRFTVAEAERGPVAIGVETHDDLPHSGNELPNPLEGASASVTERFLTTLMDELAQHGAGGAASAVRRATRNRPGAISHASSAERARIFALIDHARTAWAERALVALDQTALAARIGTLTPVSSPESAADTARWLDISLEELGGQTKTRFGDDLAPVLREIRTAASHAALLDVESDSPDDQALLSVTHAAVACARAFRLGIFTALPPEAKAIAVMLDALGGAQSEPQRSPVALREQVVTLLRVDDRIGLRELLREEQTHFERGTLERLQMAGDTLGTSADPNRLKPVEIDLWELVERRLGTLLPLAEYDGDLFAQEIASLARFAERSVSTKTSVAAWREGHRWPIWLIVWTIGVAASAQGQWTAARSLWDATTKEEGGVVPLALMHQQAGASDLGDRLTLAHFGKRMQLDGLWYLAFRLSRSDLILEHYKDMLHGPIEDHPLGFLSRAGDWAWILSALAFRSGAEVEVPKYWQRSQVDATMPARVKHDAQLRKAIAQELFRTPPQAVAEQANIWALNAPGI